MKRYYAEIADGLSATGDPRIVFVASSCGAWCIWTNVSPLIEREESIIRILHGPGTSDEKLAAIAEAMR